MRTIFKLVFFGILLPITFQEPSQQFCYTCMGQECALNNSKIVECSTGMCFTMTIEVTQTYRGCYILNGFLTAECQQKQFSSCNVCRGNLCNNNDLLDPATAQISCLKCKKGVCRPDSILPNFRRCPMFRYPELPRCYSIVDRYMDEYTFGCANEMTMEQFQMCDRDWFQSVCKFCDRPNCNTEFFRGAAPSALRCHSGVKGNILTYCHRDNNMFPYFGCFTWGLRPSENPHYGCLSDLFRSPDDVNYMNLYSHNSTFGSMYVCFTDFCNSKLNKAKLADLTKCGDQFCGTVRDEASLCALYQWDTDLGAQKLKEQCMGPFPCWRHAECKGPCHSLASSEATESCVNPSMYCFTCEDCPYVSASSPLLIRSCQERTISCVSIHKDGLVTRGCNEGHLMTRCGEVDSKNCDLCRGPACNKLSYALFCHQCSPSNPMCIYAQQDSFAVPCQVGPIKDIFDEELCYSSLTHEGQVFRGCVKKKEGCPKDVAHCSVCDTNFCNYESYVHAECLSCVGDLSSKCAKDPAFLASHSASPTRCPVGYETPHCYMSVRNGNEVRRGCVSDRNYYEVLQSLCIQSEDCLFCDGENCNYFEIHMKKPNVTHSVG